MVLDSMDLAACRILHKPRQSFVYTGGYLAARSSERSEE
jgi:hypothetical protein